MTMHRRQALHRGLAGSLALALPTTPLLAANRSAPFKRLAVMDPPFVEEYEVVIATSPPLARGTVAKLITRALSSTDSQLKSDRLTEALDPEKTALHDHFVHALADALDEADAKVLIVPVESAKNEDGLIKQVLEKAPQADGLMLANVMGRFVALHGLAAYAPGVMIGVKVRDRSGQSIWMDQIFSAGFRGIDPRAEHLDVVDMPERFDNMDALLSNIEQAREALIKGVEAIAEEVARRLMA
jgi:hypothetical protein